MSVYLKQCGHSNRDILRVQASINSVEGLHFLMLIIHQVEVQPNVLRKTQENDWQTYNTALENSAGGKVEDQKVRKQKII